MTSGRAIVAGVVGHPVAHSLSPILHNAWLAAAGIDGVYAPFAPGPDGFARLVAGFRGGVIRGLNVTLPFKEQALELADTATAAARSAAAANVLIFEPDGRVVADNTDGIGLLAAFRVQAPAWRVTSGPIALLGAGGAARGAAAALIAAGAPEVRVVNRTLARAEVLATALGDCVTAWAQADSAQAFAGVSAVINATSAGLTGGQAFEPPLAATPAGAVVMDMVYKPLETPLLAAARSLGRPTVDGLEMLIGQARPAFSAFYGCPAPLSVDVRALALAALGA
jgi:shikimate dehydrogenase